MKIIEDISQEAKPENHIIHSLAAITAVCVPWLSEVSSKGFIRNYTYNLCIYQPKTVDVYLGSDVTSHWLIPHEVAASSDVLAFSNKRLPTHTKERTH